MSEENEIFDVGFSIVFNVSSACDQQSFKELDMTPIEYIRMMIDEEGLHGIVDDDFEIQDAWIVK